MSGIADPKTIKQTILRALRGALLARESATKAELSRVTGVSFPTVSKFLAEMEASGEVRAVGLDRSSGGRRAGRYAYNPQFMLGLALYLERTETNVLVFDCRGEPVERVVSGSVLTDGVERLYELIEAVLRKHPRIRSLSIGVPAAVSDGRIIYIPDYERFQGLDVKGSCEARFALPVVVENDMNAAVLGYSKRRVGNSGGSLVYLYFGQNGPGAGLLINGRVVRGSTHFAGEVSFVPQYDRRSFREALRGGDAADPVCRLIAAYAAIVNPEAVVFSDEEVGAALLDRIREGSSAYIPAEHLPKLIVSGWKDDYLYGLQSLGLEAMIARAGDAAGEAEGE